MFADFLISTRRYEEWATEMQRVWELDPANPFSQCFYGWHLVYINQCDEAIAQLNKVLNPTPDFPAAHMGLWGAYYRKSMYEEAMTEAQKFLQYWAMMKSEPSSPETMPAATPKQCAPEPRH
jgi:predicted Zn-dependent protease